MSQNHPEFLGLLLGLAILGIAGNILMSIAVFSSRAIRTAEYLYNINLVVSDLTFAIMVLAISISSLAKGEPVVHNFIACQIVGYVLQATGSSSILTIILLAYNHYQVIVRGKSMVTYQRVTVNIGAIWLVSLVTSSTLFVGQQSFVERPASIHCHFQYSSRNILQKTLTVYLVSTVAALPVCVGFVYRMIYAKIRISEMNVMRNNGNQFSSVGMSMTNCDDTKNIVSDQIQSQPEDDDEQINIHRNSGKVGSHGACATTTFTGAINEPSGSPTMPSQDCHAMKFKQDNDDELDDLPPLNAKHRRNEKSRVAEVMSLKGSTDLSHLSTQKDDRGDGKEQMPASKKKKWTGNKDKASMEASVQSSTTQSRGPNIKEALRSVANRGFIISMAFSVSWLPTLVASIYEAYTGVEVSWEVDAWDEMFCAISGEVPREPVVSIKSGLLFEKSLILKYIADCGTDPDTNEPLIEDDLVQVKTSSKVVKPRPPIATSIPTLLLNLQNEWDSVMLETHQLKQQHHSTRLELANALYEYDAAKRVIARLIKERDEARSILAQFKETVSTTNGVHSHTAAHATDSSKVSDVASTDVDMEPATTCSTAPLSPLPEEMLQVLNQTSEELSKIRRKRKAPETLATLEAISSMTVVSENTSCHSAKEPASLALDLLTVQTENEDLSWVLSSGKDGSIYVLDANKQCESVVAHTKAHSKPVTCVAWQGASSKTLITASADHTIKTWNVERVKNSYKIKNAYVVDAHSDQVTAISVHASGDYFASAGLDSVWAISDIRSGQTMTTVSHPDVTTGYTAAQFHPDGLLLGTGTSDSLIRLWDVKSRSNAHTFTGHSGGSISSISFSENGYYLATTATHDSCVRFWDLRKLTNFHNLDLGAAKGTTGITRVRFDHSGQYVGACVGNELMIHLVKKWDHVATFSSHTSQLTDFAFGPDAKYVVMAGLDRKLTYISNAE
ncbi:hypothetical protein BASA84_000389 [Batrachochytrium salamandrivorans]|nr:hypothetical protein BASA84_000389 [Batrachochytrium salamandrivorans]